jgi:UDP-N-acetylglucosamine:LPS N-acetylglucosamine transferase
VGRPLLLTRPVPGHEAGNVDYLVGRAAALSAPTDGAVTDSLRRLFREPDLLLGLARGARAAGAPDAAGAIARLLRQGDVLDAVA